MAPEDIWHILRKGGKIWIGCEHTMGEDPPLMCLPCFQQALQNERTRLVYELNHDFDRKMRHLRRGDNGDS